MNTYPESSKSTPVLILGVVSFLWVQALAPLAWVMGSGELRAIEDGRRSPKGRRDARIGQVLGVFGSVLLAVGWVVLALHLFGVISLGSLR